MINNVRPYDLVGIGIGPSNLSLAALLQPQLRRQNKSAIRNIFFDRRTQFRWHPGLLFPNAELQVSHLKDLVSMVDPTSHYSFLAFLAANKRLYRFLMSRFPAVRRVEFEQYLAWVAAKIPELCFGHDVVRIDFHGELFTIQLASEQVIQAKNLALGVGVIPAIPPFARPHLGERVSHAATFLEGSVKAMSGRRVIVVGGGQTGAEVVHYLLHMRRPPRELIWVSRRSNFLTLDDSPFINELFTPSYSDFFFGLPEDRRKVLVNEQKLASDGITERLAEEIYRRLYTLEFHEDNALTYRFQARLTAVDLLPYQGAWQVMCEGADGPRSYAADYVVFATGFEQSRPHTCPMLSPLIDRMQLADDGSYQIRRNFSLKWDGPRNRRIFIQNGARGARGVMDPNLSLLAWRSAVIINDLLGEDIYDTGAQQPALTWHHEPPIHTAPERLVR